MKLAMIMAMDRNKLIGKAGGLPWHISADLQYFKRVTMGKPVIMGRKTYESIGRPLPGRLNIVVTRNSAWSAEGVAVASSLQQAIEMGREQAPDVEELMVIGGAALCREAMPQVERLYLTIIEHAFDGDTWLDSYDASEWETVAEERVEDAQSSYTLLFLQQERVQ